jgi:hypothetical protein
MIGPFRNPRTSQDTKMNAKLLPTVEHQKLKVQEPAISVIIWVYISYASVYINPPCIEADQSLHRFWIVLSSIVILFNKYLLDNLEFRELTFLKHADVKLTGSRFPYDLICQFSRLLN